MSRTHKGLELEVVKRGNPEFRYYYKEQVGDKRVDKRYPLGEYDKQDPDCLKKIEALWQMAHELRKAKLPIVLEFPEQKVKAHEGGGVRPRNIKAVVSHLVPEYVKHLKRSLDLSEKTTTPMVFLIRRFESEFGATLLQDVDEDSLTTYLDDLVHRARDAGNDGRSTRMNMRACLIDFFKWAIAKRYTSSNPAKATKKKKYKRDHVPVPLEHVCRYLIALRAMRRSGERLAVTHYLWLVALTGCRRDELATAKVEDFDLGKRTRLIRASRSKDEENHLTGLSHMAASVVRDQLALLKEMKLPTTRESFLFPHASGLKRLQHWHKDGLYGMGEHVIYKHHREVCKHAGVEPFKIHDFRRIFATLAASLGVGEDFQRLLISHTTGRRDVHTTDYNLHKYEHELKEAASRIAVVLDFLSSEIGQDGKRHPLECEDDFYESFGYWYSEAGRKFVSLPIHSFYVPALVKKSKTKLTERDIASGYATGDEQAKHAIELTESSGAAKVRKLGHHMGRQIDEDAMDDAKVIPFRAQSATVIDEEEEKGATERVVNDE